GEASPTGWGEGLPSRITRAGTEFADTVAARPARRADEDEVVPFARQLADLRLD
ncbi:oxidoreductase, partial [Streptomyces sp. adm13(2018)]